MMAKKVTKKLRTAVTIESAIDTSQTINQGNISSRPRIRINGTITRPNKLKITKLKTVLTIQSAKSMRGKTEYISYSPS